MHCQFALYYKLPGYSFAGLYRYVAAYIINAHACAGCKLSVLHRDCFWQGEAILAAKTGPPDIIAIHCQFAL